MRERKKNKQYVQETGKSEQGKRMSWEQGAGKNAHGRWERKDMGSEVGLT